MVTGYKDVPLFRWASLGCPGIKIFLCLEELD